MIDLSLKVAIIVMYDITMWPFVLTELHVLSPFCYRKYEAIEKIGC